MKKDMKKLTEQWHSKMKKHVKNQNKIKIKITWKLTKWKKIIVHRWIVTIHFIIPPKVGPNLSWDLQWCMARHVCLAHCQICRKEHSKCIGKLSQHVEQNPNMNIVTCNSKDSLAENNFVIVVPKHQFSPC